MTRPRLFFVDDEPQILSGLRRMLRGRRDDWDMHFFDDAASALRASDEAPATLVVTDIRMPGMDGVALMTALSERSPETIRFVLSGHSQEEAGLKAAGAAHQYLSKPTDGPVLIAAIERALALREDLQAGPVHAAVAGLTAIPTLPAAYSRLTDQLRRDPFDTAAIASAVETDPGMIAKLMQVANSSFFGAPKRITSARAAVQLLGVDTLKAMVLSYGILGQITHARIGGLPVAEMLVERMLVNAKVVDRIARDLRRPPADRELTHTAALLADVGLLVLIDNFPDDFAEAGLLDPFDADRLGRFELERFGIHHATVSAHLLGTWGLPDPIIDAIAAQSGATPPVGSPAETLGIARRVVAIARSAGGLDQLAAAGASGQPDDWPADWPDDWPVVAWAEHAAALLFAGG